MIWNLAWIPIVVAWLGWEFWSLKRQDDEKQPFTYWVRKLFSLKRGPLSLGWWIIGGLWLWLGVHFLIEGVEF